MLKAKPTRTLRGLFNDFEAGEQVAAPATAEARQSALAKAVKKVNWTATLPDLTSKVAALLDIPLSGIFVAAWKKADEVAKAMRDSKATPEEVIEVAVGDYETEAVMKPFIEVQIKGVKTGQVDVTVALTLSFKSVLLKIKAGKIALGEMGTCEIERNVKLEELELAKLKSPVKISLQPLFALDDSQQ